MDTKTVLESLGFDNKEISIYLSSLTLGEATASSIAVHATIERTLAYYILEKLLNRGLISFKLKNNVKYYSPAPPAKLLDELKEKEKTLRAALPELEGLYNLPYEGDVKVDIYKGTQGFTAVLHDMFKHGGEFLILGEEGLIQEHHPALYKQYLRRLKETNTIEKVLVREDFRGKIWKSKNSQFRYIPKELSSPTTTSIYGDKTLITIWEKPMFNIVISSKKVSQSYQSYFKHLWKIAKK